MLSINNFQMTQQPSFKGKGDKVVKEVLEKAKNMKCNPVGNIQPKEKVSVEHIIRKTPQQFSKEDKKILQLMEDMEINRSPYLKTILLPGQSYQHVLCRRTL